MEKILMIKRKETKNLLFIILIGTMIAVFYSLNTKYGLTQISSPGGSENNKVPKYIVIIDANSVTFSELSEYGNSTKLETDGRADVQIMNNMYALIIDNNSVSAYDLLNRDRFTNLNTTGRADVQIIDSIYVSICDENSVIIYDMSKKTKFKNLDTVGRANVIIPDE